MNGEELRRIVSEKYAQTALAAQKGTKGSCCEPTSCCGGSTVGRVDPITRDLYDDTEKAQLPETAMKASLKGIVREWGASGHPTTRLRLSTRSLYRVH